jgi:hypothetical protein
LEGKIVENRAMTSLSRRSCGELLEPFHSNVCITNGSQQETVLAILVKKGVSMAEKKVGDVIRLERRTSEDSSGREVVVKLVLIANPKCPKWYFRILKDTGISIEQEE